MEERLATMQRLRQEKLARNCSPTALRFFLSYIKAGKESANWDIIYFSLEQKDFYLNEI